MLDIALNPADTVHVSERDRFKLPHMDSDGWLTPEEVAKVLPNTSAKSVRDWCVAGKLKGAFQLPSRRWQIPWTAIVQIMGFDPRAQRPETTGHGGTPEDRMRRNDALPGLEEP